MYLVYNIDKGLCVVAREATDCVTLILTGEDRLDQGGELMWSERAPDQTFTGWSIKVGKVGTIGIPHKISEGGNRDIPLWDTGVAEGSVAFWSRLSIPLLRRGTLASSTVASSSIWVVSSSSEDTMVSGAACLSGVDSRFDVVGISRTGGGLQGEDRRSECGLT